MSLIAANAMAADIITAKLQAPVEGTKKPIAGQAVFVCHGDTCIAGSPTGQTLSIGGCRQLVRVVGAVSSFGSQARQLDAERLAACNEPAKK